jgi:hypothetical protein
MTQPQIERIRLLSQLTFNDELPILATYAEANIFPDTTLMEWCLVHDVRVRTEVRGSGLRSDGKSNRYLFYIFSLIPDEEW